MKDENDIDRKILKHICSGIYSYEELARLCDVSRNTIYRRIANLEKEGAIERKIMAYPDFERLNLSAVIFGMNVSPRDLDKTVDFLKGQIKVKLVWKTYGAHDIICVIICEKGEVGECIQNMKKALEELDITVLKMDSSTSISWERTDLSPY